MFLLLVVYICFVATICLYFPTRKDTFRWLCKVGINWFNWFFDICVCWKMRKILSSWLLLMASIEMSIQQCAIEESWSKINNRLFSTSTTTITINSTYYNCLSRSGTGDHYSSMSVSILYTRSDDPNNMHEVYYNLQCNNNVWEIFGNQSTAVRNNNTIYCEDCTMNDYQCTSYFGKWLKCYAYYVATQSIKLLASGKCSSKAAMVVAHVMYCIKRVNQSNLSFMMSIVMLQYKPAHANIPSEQLKMPLLRCYQKFIIKLIFSVQ